MRQVDNRARGALDRVTRGTSVQATRQSRHRRAQLVVDLSQRYGQGRIGHLTDEVLTPQRREQASVGGFLSGEVVNSQACGHSRFERVTASVQRLKEPCLGAAHTTQPHRRQQVVDRRKAMVDRAFRRSTGRDNPIHRYGSRPVTQYQVPRNIEELVDGVTFWSRHINIID